MFRQLNNIDSSFRYIRKFSLVVVLLSLLLCFFAVYQTARILSAGEHRIFILANGQILQANAADRRDNIPVEARDHIRMFHDYFFSLDPDDAVIREHLTRALYLADISAKQVYDNLTEKGYYAAVIAGNVSQRIRIDSIRFDSSRYPYYFKCFATEKIIRETSIVSRDLITEGFLRNVSRSDNNPHGFLIERWRILENKDLKTSIR